MDQLISLIVVVVIFAIVAWGAWKLCVMFAMPQPVLWIVGAILLIFLLYFISGQVGANSFHFNLRR